MGRWEQVGNVLQCSIALLYHTRRSILQKAFPVWSVWLLNSLRSCRLGVRIAFLMLREGSGRGGFPATRNV